MISSLQETLLGLFALGSVEQVHSLPAYQELCRIHEKNRTFDAERAGVEEVRAYLDDSLSYPGTARQEVDRALRLIWSLQNPTKQELYRELVLRASGSAWQSQHRAYFEQKSMVLMQSQHFFLSFTNRNAGRPNQNLVNANHKEFIKWVIGKPMYESANKSEENLLAEAIYQLLVKGSLKGFYFRKHKEDNQQVEEKLKKGCNESLSFVQLVQGETFQRNAQLPQNWCFFEYSVVKASDIPVVFVQVEDDIPNANIYVDFHDWYTEFQTRASIKLTRTPFYKPTLIDENLEKIKSLGKQVSQSLDRIYQGAPN
jgi:hypothetical protein